MTTYMDTRAKWEHWRRHTWWNWLLSLLNNMLRDQWPNQEIREEMRKNPGSIRCIAPSAGETNSCLNRMMCDVAWRTKETAALLNEQMHHTLGQRANESKVQPQKYKTQKCKKKNIERDGCLSERANASNCWATSKCILNVPLGQISPHHDWF